MVSRGAGQSVRMQSTRHPATDEDYQELNKSIDGARRRLRQALERPRSAEVRRAYVDVGQAVGRAVEFVESRVRLPYRALRPPPSTHLDPFAAAAWHSELERLRDAREELRFRALDDPHYGIPAVVVDTRAATGPDLAGLRTHEHHTAGSGDGTSVDPESASGAAADRSRPDPPVVTSYRGGLGRGASGQSRTLAPSTAA